jgi:LuxR family maltose regulon positive regulatory protein
VALLWQSQKKQNALEILYNVVQTVNENGALRTFLDVGSELPEALKALASNTMVQGDHRTIETIRHLLSNLEDENNRTPDGLSHPLSDRELEVLRLLAAGLTNKEIGEQLYLAIGTVKKHSYTIYQKLNVKNRIQAVEKSRQLRLI